MAIVMDGKEVANKLYGELEDRIKLLRRKPSLTVILVGNNEASELYVKNKTKACERLGIDFHLLRCNKNITEEELEKIINDLNQNDLCDGILVQAPLPNHLDSKKIFNMIFKEKDVDGFNNYNAGALAKNDSFFIPCTVKGIGYLLDYYHIDLSGKNVTVIGRSNIVGKPLANYLINKDATVTVCHSKTTDLISKTQTADIVISATGCPHLLDDSYIKEGAIVIDVGISKIDGKLCGDVDFEKAKNKCSYITPVPGGVGPMTVAMLMNNVVEALERKNGNG